MNKLTAKAVSEILKNVLHTDDEMPSLGVPPTNAVMVDGILHKYAFHPERIRAAKPEIDALLAELPDQFDQRKGGGWSFLNACMDRHDNHWGEHPDMERLICLGIGAGSASWIMKDMMDVLPGGMPYFEVHPETAPASALRSGDGDA